MKAVFNPRLGVLLLFSVFLLAGGCGRGSDPYHPVLRGSPASTQIADSEKNKQAAVSQILWQEEQGESPEEIQAVGRAPVNYIFSTPLKTSLLVSYFYGPRIWSSFQMSQSLESGRAKDPVILIHASEHPLTALLQPGGKKHWEFHGGIDLTASDGTPVYSTADGVVFSTGTRPCVGDTVVIRHDLREGQEKVYSIYNHLQPGSYKKIKIGDKVQRGALIAKSGHTGSKECIQGSHLHFEIRTPVSSDVSAGAIGDWSKFLSETARQNPADYVKEIDQACQKRKWAEMNNAVQVARQEPGAVAPLSASRCSMKFESRIAGAPAIYRVTRADEISTLGLK